MNNQKTDSFTIRDSKQLKGIAIGMILAHHLFFNEDYLGGLPVKSLIFSMNKVFNIAQFSKTGVALFVFITAYAYMVKTSGKDLSMRDIEKMSFKRLISMMIPFWLVFVIMQIICNIIDIRSYGDVYKKGVKSVFRFLIDGMGLADCFNTPLLCPTWWYMSLAILLIFAMPLIGKASERFGISLLAAAFILVKFYKVKNYWVYIVVAILASVMQTHDFFGKTKALMEKKKGGKFLGLLAIAVCLLSGYFIYNHFHKWTVVSFVIAVPAIALLQHAYLSEIKPLAKVLEFVGDHSMNIFLIHTFLYYYFFGHAFYHLKYTFLIWLALLCASLLCSIAIKFIYRILKLDKLKVKAITAIDNL